jgi:hypothetical protein
MGDQKVRGEPLCEGWDRGGRVHKPSTGPITGQDTLNADDPGRSGRAAGDQINVSTRARLTGSNTL